MYLIRSSGVLLKFKAGGSTVDLCWSRSHLVDDDGNWEPCKPKGYGGNGWTEYSKCTEDDNSDDSCLNVAWTTVAYPVPSLNKLNVDEDS